MRILISNDDGVGAEGIRALAAEFARVGTVVVVAPERERSTTGHSLTLHKPLRLRQLQKGLYYVSGGPADCIYLGIHEVLKGKRPDLVLSGINRGANMGQDVFYSGTCSAAREAASLGIPSVAVSLAIDFKKNKPERYATAAKAARRVLEEVLPLFSKKKGWKAGLKAWPAGMMLNINVPNLPETRLKGIRPATQGFRLYGSNILKRVDSRGRNYYWIGGTYEGYRPIPESDCWYVDRGYVSVTPLELDTTRIDIFDFLQKGFGLKKKSHPRSP